MKLELHSQRLLLRPLAAEDLELAVELFTDPEVMTFVGEPYTAEKIAEEMPVALSRGGAGCIGIWCILDRVTGEKLGETFLLPLAIEGDDTDWDLVGGPGLPEAEIETGYFLRRPAWGKGYATETIRRLIRFAFEDTPLEELVAVIDPKNDASHNVLLKAGFTEEGPRRAYAAEMQGFRISRVQWIAQHGGAG